MADEEDNVEPMEEEADAGGEEAGDGGGAAAADSAASSGPKKRFEVKKVRAAGWARSAALQGRADGAVVFGACFGAVPGDTASAGRWGCRGCCQCGCGVDSTGAGFLQRRWLQLHVFLSFRQWNAVCQWSWDIIVDVSSWARG
jgi:hypothetical protein